MFSITFYSFRGGVGRTMAVANVAYQLARSGRSVFLIDFDLEAPGLTLMPELLPEEGQGPATRGGLMAFLRAGLEDKPIPKVRDLAYRPRIASTEGVKGAMHVLPAGALAPEDEAYDLRPLQLRRLYETKQRAVVIDDLKRQIEDDFDQPEYLLIDSRTGLTETGGICTTHLADYLVVLSGLNEQNVKGTSLFLRMLRKAQAEAAQRVLFVASPVPVGEEDLKSKRLAHAKERFAAALGVDVDQLPDMLAIPYHPELALSEANFVVRFPDSPQSRAYRAITRDLRARNPLDLDFRTDQAFDRLRTGAPGAIEEIQSIAASPGAPAMALVAYAVILDVKEHAEEAEEFFRRAVNADPKHVNSLGSFAVFLSKHGRNEEAEEYYRRAEEADPKHANNLGNFAVFLGERERFEEAEEYYKRAVEAAPKHANNLGNFAVFLAQRERFEEAEKYYKRAVEADPKHANHLGNFAVFLQQRERFEEAEEFFRRAVEAAPKDADILGNFANLLQQRERFEEAEGYYKRAVEADPKHANHLGNFAWLLYDHKGDLHRALEYTERSLAGDADQAVFAMNRGLFLTLLNRGQEGRRQYEKALALESLTEKVLAECVGDLESAGAKRAEDADVQATLAWLGEKARAWRKGRGDSAGKAEPATP